MKSALCQKFTCWSFTVLVLAAVQINCSREKSKSPDQDSTPPQNEPTLTNQTKNDPTDNSKTEKEQCEASQRVWQDGVCKESPASDARAECDKDPKKTWTGEECIDRILDPNTLFDPAFHCERKPSGAFAGCQPIPRAGLTPILVSISPVTETQVELIKGLTFSSQLVYSYYCPGGVQQAFLKLNQSEHSLVQTDKEPSAYSLETPISYGTDQKYNLVLAPKSFTTISSQCRIVILKNWTVLHETSRDLLEKAYIQSPDAAIKDWVNKELERIKDADKNYADYLKTF